VLEQIDAVIMRHVRRVEMQRGDVVLLDSYQACGTDARPSERLLQTGYPRPNPSNPSPDPNQVLHGREPFSGAREHGVMWLTSKDFAPPADGDAPGEGGGDDGSPAGAFSRAVNWFAVKRTGV